VGLDCQEATVAASINIHEAKTHFSRLIERASNGETLIIAKAGKPVAKIVPLEEPTPKPKRRLGGLEGQIKVPDDFDRMFEDEIAEMFYGK
jgi:prevent-host-death family protein